MNSKLLLSALFALLTLASPVLADTITITSIGIATTTLNPSSDTITLNSGSASLSSPSYISFQTGSVYAGDSEIPDQVASFYLYDTITINNISRVVTLMGRDNITNSADLITLSAAAPINFGAYSLTLDSPTYSLTSVGQYVDVNLSGTVSLTPTPEPASLLLIATGLGGAGLLFTRSRSAARGNLAR